MRIPLSLVGLLVAINSNAFSSAASESNVTYFGAPRYSIEGVLSVLDIAESYIRSQTDGSAKTIGSTVKGACSRDNPCVLGSCCNSDGHCGYRPEHCSPPAPKLCVANCDAKAPCGEFSADGKTVCPLNVCCSKIGFCGTSDSFCRDTIAASDGSQCRGGNCGAIDAPSCGKGSGTASRRIAYYESWNSRRRPCDKVLPSQLDVSGLTHLVLAFATIDPKTFEVRPMNPDDEDIYKQFLALPDSVSKWIGIGGFEFTDPGATRYTWSDMTSSKENRKAFIDSLQRFLSKWNFRGVDIDWEWPGHESRGGKPQDGANQAELLKEMRQTFGSNFGLGVVIPAQYEYMKNMDTKSLEAQVDWLTILTYDLHGPWDLPWDPKIKPHTDSKEIDESLRLLWSNNIDSKKVNMGIANYGRGYTVADKNCMYYGCAFIGPSKAGSCTLQDGVLSTCEIQRLINEKHLTYKVIAGGAEANEVTWDDQWVSFDDSNTLGKKLELANDRCLGGTALWAIDYATCSGDGSSPQPEPSQPGPSQPGPSQPGPSQPGPSQPGPSQPGPSQPGPSQPGPSQPGPSQPGPSQPGPSQPGPSQPGPSQPGPSQPGPSQPTSTPASSFAPSSAPPVATSQSSPAWTSAMSNSSQRTSAGPSSSPTSTQQGSSQVGSSSSAISSSPPASTPQVLPSDASSSTWAGPTSAASGSSSPSQGSSAVQSSAPTNTQVHSGTSLNGSQTSTGAAIPSSTTFGSSIPAPASSSSIPSSVWSSSQTGSSGQASSTGQPDSSRVWSTSDMASSTFSTSSIAGSASSVAWSSESSVALSSSGNPPSASSSASSTSSSVAQASSEASSGLLSKPPVSTSSGSSSQATPTEPSSQGSSVPRVTISNIVSMSSIPGTATWGSSSESQSISGSVTSSVAPPSSSWNQAPSSSSAVSSAVASSSTAQSSAAQLSTAQTSTAQTSAVQSSTVQSSASASSQPADSSKLADSSGNATPTTAGGTTVALTGSMDATSVIATVTLSSMILPPPKWECPVECGTLDWCRVFCSGERPWPPPTECWWFDWCMLWWGFATVKKTTPEKPECKLLGCGCGFMGLPWGPGCPNDRIPFPINIIIRIFGLFPTPCLFWGCGSNCGILGCGGWCFGKDGCTECPKLLCPHGGPKIGPIPTNFPPVDPPGPTDSDGKPKACEVKDAKTATERFVYCGEFLYLSSAVLATTVSSVASTSVTTSSSSSSMCYTVFDVTLVGCNVKDHLETTTTSVTESNTLSGETSGPACTRAPLSLDDDEGNNIPIGWDSSSITFASNTTGLSSPTSTPTPDCSKCWEYFDKTCIPQRCKPDDPENCAFRCLSDMCLAPNSPEPCWKGHSCAHKSCPNDTMGALPSNFTATLTFSAGPTLTVTLPSSSAYSKTNSSSSAAQTSFQVGTSTTAVEVGTSQIPVEVGTSQIPKPTPGPMDKNGTWKVSVHVWMENMMAKIECELYDPNGNKAGETKMFPREGNESIEIYIESDKGRASEHSMPFGVKAWFNNPITIDKARVEFEIQKNMPNCDKISGVPCKPHMETENKLETSAFFVDVCWQYCDPKKPEHRLLNTWDLDCQDLNDADWQRTGNGWMRNFDCHWKGF